MFKKSNPFIPQLTANDAVNGIITIDVLNILDIFFIENSNNWTFQLKYSFIYTKNSTNTLTNWKSINMPLTTMCNPGKFFIRVPILLNEYKIQLSLRGKTPKIEWQPWSQITTVKVLSS
eukprot:440950_1